MNLPLRKVISGGQNGVDQAALRAARGMGLETGGWAPRGFLTLDGPHPSLGADYGLVEHESPDYPPRTRENVLRSDATLRLATDFSSAGERCTLRAIEDLGRSHLDVDLSRPIAADAVHDWLRARDVKVLNVAGNSERTSPGIGDVAYSYLLRVFGLEHEFSATQLESDERCRRYFWFRYVANLPELQSTAQLFGSALHAVVERWLRADQAGRDVKTGQPVDLYPAGWDEGITPVEADLVRRLVQAAVESAVIERHPARHVEAEFRDVPIVPGATVRGYIDVVAPDGIHDHKTSKNVERYAKSPAALRSDSQLLLYAKIWLEDRRMDGKPDPEQVLLRHNYFSKDPSSPIVRPVTAFVTPAEVDAAWRRTQVRASELLSLKRSQRISSFEDADAHWRKVPGAVSPGDSDSIRSASYDHPCRKYGGCAFAEVCGGVKKPSEYAAEVNRRNSNNHDDQGGTMGLDIFAARRAAAAANGSTTAPPVSTTAVIPSPAQASPAPAPSSPTTQAVAAPAQNKVLPSGAPPWGRAECGACEGLGFNSKGDVCRPCRGNANSQGKPSPDWFELFYDNGEASWEVKKEFAEAVEKALGSKGAGGSIRIAGAVEAVVQAKVQAAPSPPPAATVPSPPSQPSIFNQRAPKQAPSATAPGQAVPQPQASTQSAASTEKQKPIKFTLLLDCHPRGGVNGVVRLDEIFHRYAALLAVEEKKDSYWELPAFTRREKLASCVNKIAEAEKFHGGKYVTASTGTPDLREFAEAMAGIAAEVICGASGR